MHNVFAKHKYAPEATYEVVEYLQSDIKKKYKKEYAQKKIGGLANDMWGRKWCYRADEKVRKQTVADASRCSFYVTPVRISGVVGKDLTERRPQSIRDSELDLDLDDDDADGDVNMSPGGKKVSGAKKDKQRSGSDGISVLAREQDEHEHQHEQQVSSAGPN